MKSRSRLLLGSVLAMGVAGTGLAAAPDPWLDRARTPEARADALIARLRGLDEKLAVLGGAGLARFGLVAPMGSDGPAGPAHGPGTISLPNTLSLAASFDPALAADYGRAVATEFRAAGMAFMIGPTLDIARTWKSGRVPEGLGEDPLLTATIAVPMVKAEQAGGVAVTLKHFTGYVQEQGRTGDAPFGTKPGVDVVVPERVLRELYMPAFRAAVQQGGALGVMCAFPRINGTYACENPYLYHALKTEWGFRGTVGPDFPDAQRSVVAAVNAGLDSGNFGLPRPPMPAGPPPAMPEGAAPPGATPPAGPSGGGMPDLGKALGLDRIPGGIPLKQAIETGQVPEKRLDDMIRRRLVTMFAVNGERPIPPDPQAGLSPALRAFAVRAAEAGAVLLRNEGGVLPLGPQVRRVAVIGDNAGPAPQVSTSGSSYVPPHRVAPALDAIRARAGGATVTYARGSLPLGPLPAVDPAVFATPDGKPGLRADYAANPNLDFAGAPLATRTDATVDVAVPTPVAGLPADNLWSVRWTGTLTPRRSGLTSFTLAGAGSGRLFIDDTLVARFDRVDFGAVGHAAVPLTAGRKVAVRVEWTPREAAPLPGIPMMNTTLGTLVRLGWAEPDERIAQAVAAAKAADVAVVFAADRHGEGADRSELKLPGDQDQLIAAVAAANPRTVVVLNTAGPVSMPWLPKVKGVLEMWYPGETFGEAAAALLFGDAAPGGRLPISFPADETQGPAVAERTYPGLPGPSGALDKVQLDEGLRVGYRWFDASGQRPLFPFGHGLTYSPMPVSGAAVAPDGTVTASVSNRGTRPDTQVVQVYLAFPSDAGEPPKRLAAFTRVALGAGETRAVSLPLPPEAFQVWDEGTQGWRTPAGEYRVLVGTSAADAVQAGRVTR